MATSTVGLLRPNKLFRQGLKHRLTDAPFQLTLKGAGLQVALEHQADAPESILDLVLLDLAGEAAVLRVVPRRRRETMAAGLLKPILADLQRRGCDLETAQAWGGTMADAAMNRPIVRQHGDPPIGHA